MNLRVGDLQCVQFPGEVSHLSSESVKAIYKAAFECWKKVWSLTFKELDGTERIFSDDFTRQSYVSAIMYGPKCVAMGFLHEVDFSSPIARDDSYFKVWSKEALDKLVEDGPRVLVASNLTVDPDFRGVSESGLSLKNLVVGLVTKNLMNSKMDVMTGTMRCDRGAHRSAYLYGATPIQKSVVHHGVEVDLVGFYRHRLESESLVADTFVETLWKNRKDFGFDEVLENKNKKEA